MRLGSVLRLSDKTSLQLNAEFAETDRYIDTSSSTAAGFNDSGTFYSYGLNGETMVSDASNISITYGVEHTRIETTDFGGQFSDETRFVFGVKWYFGSNSSNSLKNHKLIGPARLPMQAMAYTESLD